MIHLDRSLHHDLDQSQKQNLILSRDHGAPHFDWDDLSHTQDGPPFFHDALHDALQSPHNLLNPDAVTSPIHTQHDLRDDKSSSLSPAPDSGSPQAQQNAVTPVQALPLTTPDKQELDLAVEGTLTPLTELSPAPELEDGPEDTKDTLNEHKETPHPSTSFDGPSRRLQPTVHINGTTSPPTSSTGSPSRQHPTADFFAFRPNGGLGSSHSRTSSGDFLVPPLPTGAPPQTMGESKILRILELNAELLKLCSEFHLRGIPLGDHRVQQYTMRVQVNLHWLAAAADQRHNNPNIALPIMEPPIAIESVPMDRLKLLYSDISTVFAKDIARRQLLHPSHQGPLSVPSTALNGTLKRTRPDDLSDLSTKRRDMGEHKPQVPQAPIPGISLSSAPHPTPSTTFPPSSQANLAGSTAPVIPQSPRVSSPAMPPPATPSLPFGPTEASIAASTRARARDIQIQQAREQQLRQAAQMQQMQPGRHMSPPSTSQQVAQGIPGPSNVAFSHQAQSILQNHNHPLMQYMISQVPQFTSLPPQQQMQRLQMVQVVAQQRQQQQQQLQNNQMASPQRNPQMVGMAPNTPMPAMSNGALSVAGGQGPVSPLAQQPPVMSQQQQQPQSVTTQPAQNGMFSFGQGHPNPGMDPRMASANFSSQMAGGMSNNMNVNQQRQMMLMQQQMRNTNGNMGGVPNMMNPQHHAYAMAQRMAQAGPSQPSNGVGGSPLSTPAGDQFPALRSNSTIPGIARSARSPSDSLHSPMTPRAPSRLSQQPQLPQNDYSHTMMQHPHGMTQNMGTFNPQVQGTSWPQNGQQPMQQQMAMMPGQMNGYAMGTPNGAGMAGFFGSTPSPTNANWQPQPQAMSGSYPYGQTMSQHTPPDQSRLSHMANMSLQNMGPMGDGTAPGEYDLFSYNGS